MSARKGVAVKVKIYGPLPGDNIQYVNWNKPLSGDYFETTICQIILIEAELRTIKRVTVEAMDRILSRETIHYRTVFSDEANVKHEVLAHIDTIYEEDKNFTEIPIYRFITFKIIEN